MIRPRRALSLALFLMMVVLTAQAQPEPYTVNGPFGGRTEQLSVYPVTPERLYAVAGLASTHQLYTREFGDPWEPVVEVDGSRLSAYLPAYWTDERDESRLWVVPAGDDAILAQGSPAGGDFLPVNLPIQGEMLQVVPSPSDNDRTYLLTRDVSGFYQLYAQNVWGGGVEIVNPLINGMVAVYGGDTDTLYTTGLWSTNSGDSWLAYGGNLAGERLWTDPQDPDRSLFRVRIEDGPGGDFVLEHSSNRGFSWTEKFSADSIRVVSFDPDGGILLTTGTERVWFSEDGGDDWEWLEDEFPELLRGAASEQGFTSDCWLAFDSGVYRSFVPWLDLTFVGHGIIATELSCLAAPGQTDVNNDADTLLAGGPTGVYRSLDWGETWERTFDQPVISLSVHGTDPTRAWAVGRDTIYQSFNCGESWQAIDFMPDDEISAVLADPTDDQRVFVRTAGGVERSINNGFNWVQIWSDASETLTHRLASNSGEPARIFSHTDDSIVLSDNGGFDWEEIALPDSFDTVTDYLERGHRWVMTDSTIYFTTGLSGDNGWANLRLQQPWDFPPEGVGLSRLLVTDTWSGNGGGVAIQFLADDGRLYTAWVALFSAPDGTVTPVFDVAPHHPGELDNYPVPDDGIVAFLGTRSGAAAYASNRGGVYTSPDAYVNVDEGPGRENVAVGNALPARFTLSPAYPNPFNPSTTLTLEMPLAGEVVVTVSNLLGQRVAVLHDGRLAPGVHTLTWNAASHAAGVYLVQADLADGPTVTRRVTLVK